MIKYSISLLIIYVLISSIGLYYIKISENVVLSLAFLVGFLFYGTGFVIWLLILKNVPLSIAFPVASSSLILATQVIGIYRLGEPLTKYKIFGSLFIIVGITLFFLNNRADYNG